MRVPVLVALSGGDKRVSGAQRREEGGTRRGVRPVVTDLQDVDRGQHAATEEQGLDGRLGITGEQHPEGAVLEQRDDRGVVDVALGQRPGRVGIGWEEDGQARAGVEGMHLAGASQDGPCAAFRRGQREEARIGRVVVGPPAIEHEAHAVARQRGDEARHVVLVRVGEEHEIDPSLPEGKRLAESLRREIGVRPTVDEQRRPRRGADEDGVALADVEHGHVQPAVGLSGKRQARHRGCGGECQRYRPEHSGQPGRGQLGDDAIGPGQTTVDEEEERIPGARQPRRCGELHRCERHRRGGLPGDDHEPKVEPGGAAEHPAQPVADERRRARVAERARHRGQRRSQHDDRHERHHQHVGQRRHEGQALEVQENDRQRRQLCREGERDRFAHRPRPSGKERFHAGAEPDQPRGGQRR